MKKIQVELENKSDEYTSHLVIGIDQDENGYPESTMTMSSAKPLELIGMCTQLIDTLKSIRKKAIAQMKPRNKGYFTDSAQFEELTDKLPKPIADKIRDFKKRMDAAVDSGDFDEMRKVKDELLKMKNPFGDLNDDSDNSEDSDKSGGFNINDFK